MRKFHASRQIYRADERKRLMSTSTTIHDEDDICDRIDRYGVALQFQLYRPDRFERVALIHLDQAGAAINYKQSIGVRSIEYGVRGLNIVNATNQLVGAQINHFNR